MHLKVFLLLVAIGMSFVICRAEEAYNHHLLTWNMQGAQGEGGESSKWTDLVAFLKNNDIFMAALQECGAPPHGSATLSAARLPPTRLGSATHQGDTINEYELQLGTSGRGKKYYLFHLIYETRNGNTGESERTNMAIVSKVKPKELIIQRNSAESRPIFCIRIESQFFCNVHADAHGGNDIATSVDNLEKEMRRLQTRKGNYLPSISWVILGDFNREPASLEEKLSQVSGRTNPSRIVHTSEATHIGKTSSKTYDYMITAKEPGPLRTIPVISAEIVRSLGSDHKGVHFSRS